MKAGGCAQPQGSFDHRVGTTENVGGMPMPSMPCGLDLIMRISLGRLFDGRSQARAIEDRFT